MDNKELEQHESYGMMSFNRFDGGNGAFFGSSIKPDGGIEMTLKTGEVRHNLNHDWYRGKETIARVRMTGAQFADLITNLNMGEGVPVTLEYVHGKHMSEPPFINKRIQFEENFKQEMKEVSNQMLELTKRTEEILSRAKAPTKKEKEEILHNIAMLNQKVSSDMPHPSRFPCRLSIRLAISISNVIFGSRITFPISAPALVPPIKFGGAFNCMVLR